MACRDVWNTWPSGPRSPQNPPASPSGFVVTGGPRAMYFTHHGKPWLKPITLTDFPTSIRLTSLALWQSNDCPSASKATLMNMDKYFMWIHYERLHNHNKAKHNETVCIFLGIYCITPQPAPGITWLLSNMVALHSHYTWHASTAV